MKDAGIRHGVLRRDDVTFERGHGAELRTAGDQGRAAMGAPDCATACLLLLGAGLTSLNPKLGLVFSCFFFLLPPCWHAWSEIVAGRPWFSYPGIGRPPRPDRALTWRRMQTMFGLGTAAGPAVGLLVERDRPQLLVVLGWSGLRLDRGWPWSGLRHDAADDARPSGHRHRHRRDLSIAAGRHRSIEKTLAPTPASRLARRGIGSWTDHDDYLRRRSCTARGLDYLMLERGTAKREVTDRGRAPAKLARRCRRPGGTWLPNGLPDRPIFLIGRVPAAGRRPRRPRLSVLDVPSRFFGGDVEACAHAVGCRPADSGGGPQPQRGCPAGWRAPNRVPERRRASS